MNSRPECLPEEPNGEAEHSAAVEHAGELTAEEFTAKDLLSEITADLTAAFELSTAVLEDSIDAVLGPPLTAAALTALAVAHSSPSSCHYFS